MSVERRVSIALELPVQNVIDVKFLGCEQTGRGKCCLVGGHFIMADKFEDVLLCFGHSFNFRTVDFP